MAGFPNTSLHGCTNRKPALHDSFVIASDSEAIFLEIHISMDS